MLSGKLRKGVIVLPGEREKIRREMTHLLMDALGHIDLGPKAAALVAEFIDNYEFVLAYEIMVEELAGTDVPAEAAASLKEAGIRMGKISN